MTIGRITIERGTVAHTCPDCMRGLPCQPAQPAPETRTSSLSRVVADAVNAGFDYEVDALPDHLIRQCVHGTVISQCRCASKNKHVIVAPQCPPWCTGTTAAPQPEGQTTSASPFKAPIYFGPTNHTPRTRTDSEWKRDQFPTPEVM